MVRTTEKNYEKNYIMSCYDPMAAMSSSNVSRDIALAFRRLR